MNNTLYEPAMRCVARIALCRIAASEAASLDTNDDWCRFGTIHCSYENCDPCGAKRRKWSFSSMMVSCGAHSGHVRDAAKAAVSRATRTGTTGIGITWEWMCGSDAPDHSPSFLKSDTYAAFACAR